MDQNHLTIEMVDRDGAIAEAAEAVAGDSRADFLRKAGLAAGGGLIASGILGTGFAGRAAAAVAAPAKQAPASDVALRDQAYDRHRTAEPRCRHEAAIEIRRPGPSPVLGRLGARPLPRSTNGHSPDRIVIRCGGSAR